ncbi:hypothetical protein [Niallia sp. 03133]|uniref:hypothetical protein n=1 Tax=Niallia sp. 03133 TaxID=3458060 RepID=UPI00404446AB
MKQHEMLKVEWVSENPPHNEPEILDPRIQVFLHHVNLYDTNLYIEELNGEIIKIIVFLLLRTRR